MTKDADDKLEIKRGRIRHQDTRQHSLGIEILRLERKLEPILKKWREAVKRDSKAWK